MTECLHCVLIKALTKWFKSHHASDDDVVQMLGKFAVEALANRPGFKGSGVRVMVMEVEFDSETSGTLH